MKIRIWGARGSIPSPLKPQEVREKIYQVLLGSAGIDTGDPEAVRKYVNNLSPLLNGTAGGNTPCVEIQAGQETFIIDAGSGLRELGLELMKGPCGRGEGVLHLFISHTHWDHIQGFPFFRPAFVPGNRLLIYSVHDLRTILDRQQHADNFPVSTSYLQASLEFVPLHPAQILSISGVKVKTLRTIHPGDAYAFRFEDERSVFVYASDAEYKQLNEASLRPYLDFFRGADVLIFDAQFTLREAWEKADWGHSSSLIGADLARRAGVKKLVLFHHDPTYSEADLMTMQADTIEYQAQDASRPTCEVIVAYEGLTFDLTESGAVNVRHLPNDEIAILTLPATFDERGVEELEHQLARWNDSGWPPRLVIDLSAVETLTVAGLKSLISLRREHEGTSIVLANLSTRVRRVIELAGFLDFFAVYPSVRTALAALKARETLNLPGRLLNDRYRIEHKLGDGRLGRVFKARDTHLSRTVAVKVLSASFSERALGQFLHQARQVLSLDHPNIVSVFECDEDQGYSYLVEEFIEGQPLHRLMEKSHHRPLSDRQAVAVGLDIARALEYAHSQGVIHGDLNPKNVLLADRVKLHEFGLGRLEEGPLLADTPLALLTAHYLAPEQILGKPLDARTDLYALGAILYELCTGRPPFAGSDQEVIQAHLHQMPLPPSEFNANLSHSLERLILKLLAKNPAERYASAQQVGRALRRLVNSNGSDATSASPKHQPGGTLIGPEGIRQALLAAWQEARAGRGQIVFIAGEAGIGKTHLVRAIAAQAETGVSLVGHCHPFEVSTAYQPFIEVLQAYLTTLSAENIDKQASRLLGDVAHLMPDIRHFLPNLPAAAPLEAKQEQLRLRASLTEFIERAAQDRPWLLILEDLQWADPDSLQLIHHLARHCVSAPLLIIGTYRDDDLRDDQALQNALRDLNSSSPLRVLSLNRLNQAEVGQMLVDVWEQAVPPAVAKRIHQHTEGNPLYVKEVARALLNKDVPALLAEGEEPALLQNGVQLPPSLPDVILQRVAALKQETQILLYQAAILGPGLNVDDLRAMGGQAEAEVVAYLREAQEHQFIEENPGQKSFEFSHVEIRQALYDDLSASYRRMLHRQAGEALERRYRARLKTMAGKLAYHFGEAGKLRKSLLYSIQAARQADEVRAGQRAIVWYSRALEILSRLGQEKSIQGQVFELLLARERIYEREGIHDEQAADLAALQKLSQRFDDPVKQALVHIRQADYQRRTQNYPVTNTHAQLGLDAARQAEDPILEGESWLQLARLAEDQDQVQNARQHLETAQAVLAKTADRRAEAAMLNRLGQLQVVLNDYDRAQSYYERALEMSRAFGDQPGEAVCLSKLGDVACARGNYSLARAFYEQSLDVNQALGIRQAEATALNDLSLAHVALGNHKLAKICVEHALALCQSIDDQVGVAEALRTLSAILHAREQYEKARDYAQQSLKIFQNQDSRANVVAAWLRLALTLESLGELKAAHQAYIHALKDQLEEEVGILEMRAGIARCLLAQNDVANALVQIESGLSWLGKQGLSDVGYSLRFYLTAYQVLRQAGKGEAAEKALADGYALLQKRLAFIEDRTLRRSFLENVPQNRALMQTWAEIRA